MYEVFLGSPRLGKQAYSRMQQPAGRAAGTRRRTPRLVVLPNKARPMHLLYSTDAQTIGEADVMDCE